MAIELTFNLFVRVHEDFEKRQYLILHALQQIRRQFRANQLYPELAELIDLYNQLIGLKHHLDKKRESFPKRIKEIDIENKKIEYEEVYGENINVSQVKSLIEWAEPHMADVINEGVEIYDYIEKRTEVESVGILPEYKDEGFMLIPDQIEKELKVYKYQVSIFNSSKDRYRAMRTTFLKELDALQPAIPLNKIKLDLVEEYSEYPNPATFSFNIEEEFPFKRTVFPIVKRKMIKHLYSAGGEAN